MLREEPQHKEGGKNHKTYHRNKKFKMNKLKLYFFFGKMQ